MDICQDMREETRTLRRRAQRFRVCTSRESVPAHVNPIQQTTARAVMVTNVSIVMSLNTGLRPAFLKSVMLVPKPMAAREVTIKKLACVFYDSGYYCGYSANAVQDL